MSVCATGAGQYYCVECSKYFMNQDVLDQHKLSKSHKQRVKRLLKDKPWTTEDARVIGVDNGKPLGRAPKPVQFADSPALAYQNGAKPLTPSEAAARISSEQVEMDDEDVDDDEEEEQEEEEEAPAKQQQKKKKKGSAAAAASDDDDDDEGLVF